MLLFFLATARAVHTICEQPASSLMWVFPYMRFYQNVVSRFVDYTCAKLPGAQAYIYVTTTALSNMGAYGAKTLKPTHLCGTWRRP